MTRKEMLTKIIHLYGFEHTITIQFAQMCETMEENDWNNHVLEILVKAHQENPVYDF